ncbi:hypothetical protein MASR1M32_32170 [Rhodobacter sp.]
MQKVSGPFRALSREVGDLTNWLNRARKAEANRRKTEADLTRCGARLAQAEAEAEQLARRSRAINDAHRRAAWLGMARNALSTRAPWDSSLFADALKPDAMALLELFVAQDGEAGEFDVTAHSLHRQVRRRVHALQASLTQDGDGIARAQAEDRRARILEGFPEVRDPVDEQGLSAKDARVREVVHDARQALEDASRRNSDAVTKAQSELDRLQGLLDLPEGLSDLATARSFVEEHLHLQERRLKDVEPLEDWLELLDQWAAEMEPRPGDRNTDERLREDYVRLANVVGITCNANFKDLEKSGFPRFDVVIIDEVSKATPLELLRPMLLAPKSILVGDHRQLPPTFSPNLGQKSRRDSEADETDDDLERERKLLAKYQRLATGSLFRDGFKEINAASRASLMTQYRMHPQIMGLVNRFYDGGLKSGLTDPDGTGTADAWSWRIHGLTLASRTGGHYLKPDQHAIWIDSSKDERGAEAYETKDAGAYSNKLEARLVAQIVADIVGARPGGARQSRSRSRPSTPGRKG